MAGQISEERFLRALRDALRQLYNPAALRRNPLNDLLGIRDRAGGLQEVLLDAVRALNPGRGASIQSDARRTYQILLHRYVDQFSQSEVAMSLGLSVRQLRRQERLAIYSLGEYLRTRYALQIAPNTAEMSHPLHDEEGADDEGEGEEETASGIAEEPYQEDLAWLAQTAPQELLDMGEMITGAVQLLEPLFRELGLSVQCRLSPMLPRVAANAMALRQALVITLTAVGRLTTGRQLYITATADEDEVRVAIRPAGQKAAMPSEIGENLAMAQRLVALSGGSLSVVSRGDRDPHPPATEPAPVTLTLPLAQPVTTLIIEDNQDALHLFQRFLTGTRYHPVVTRDPNEGLAMAQQLSPKAILLDVMLPGMDGWEMLARLRRHPATQHIPVIVCTILPEEQLAWALGASGFLRKPFSREELLAALQAAT